MRAATRISAALAAALALAGCSGPDALRAQQVLDRALAAGAKLESATFEADVTVTADGMSMTVHMSGGGYTTGARAGDMYMTLRMAGVPGFEGSFDIVKRGSAAWFGLNGSWQRTELPASFTESSDNFAPRAFEELARYVKDVRVNEQQVVNGERAVTVAGELDTAAMLRGLAKMSSLSDAVGNGFDMSKVADSFGDTQIVLVVSEQTGLITAAMIRLTVTAQGKQGTIRIAYRLTSANTPIAFPKVS